MATPNGRPLVPGSLTTWGPGGNNDSDGAYVLFVVASGMLYNEYLAFEAAEKPDITAWSAAITRSHSPHRIDPEDFL